MIENNFKGLGFGSTTTRDMGDYSLDLGTRESY